MAKIKITQVKSLIGANKVQCQTLKALGIRKLNHTVEKEANGAILGMVKRVSHLVKIENV